MESSAHLWPKLRLRSTPSLGLFPVLEHVFNPFLRLIPPPRGARAAFHAYPSGLATGRRRRRRERTRRRDCALDAWAAELRICGGTVAQ